MVIIAWNDSGSLSNIFDGDVFKKVLSIFITAAILKLAQGKIKPTPVYFAVCVSSVLKKQKKSTIQLNLLHQDMCLDFT